MPVTTKVIVVDDSLTMRALIAGALERIAGVEVVGLADGAAEAREMMESLRPHVMTLDVEMPGMSGIDYLAEVMERRPMPVIMFSTRTTDGASESIEALRLGAIDCFPKPRVAAPAELDAIIARLGKRIKQARNMELKAVRPAAAVTKVAPIDWSGRLVVVGGDASSTAAMFEMFTAFPANCPPVLIVQHLAPGLLDSMVAKLGQQIAPRVTVAADGMAIEQGTLYFAPPGDHHLIVDAWPNGRVRLLTRDPVAGERPSISLLFASAAKAAGTDVVGTLLIDGSEDGGGGVKAMTAAGGYTIAPAAGGGHVLARGMVSQPVARDALAQAVLKLCSR
ncbi:MULTISPECIES: chemotaxis protein CheB [unclassified Sphingomonas]|uniref:chemotaxis protein CheB n=1 Tax=unclassified Sphingomonas TaxID=196159 RepID=UPI000A64BFB5|nr:MULTISPECIES: chemotaxis protein CheB [unclassified Sphingomonas]